MRTRVALTLSRQDTPGRRDAAAQYVAALEAAGAEVITVEPTSEPPSEFDALCLSGGGDVDPLRYGHENVACDDTIDTARDQIELALLDRALAADLPVLGICRGFQVLNVHLGGVLVQHVDGHREKNAPLVPHVASAEAGSRVADACGAAPFAVNSYHHQAVAADGLAAGLRAVTTIDGLVEAFESERHSWVVGVQWHPERADVAPAAKGIFGAFVRAGARAPIPAR